MEIRALRDGEQDACLDLWGIAFASTGRDYFVKYFTRDATWEPADTIVCVVDGQFVSAATAVRRTVTCGAERYLFGGVANVGTLPEARGKGYSTGVLRQLIVHMKDVRCDFALLGTGIPDFYARLGFVRWPIRALEGTPRPGGDPGALRPATGDDLPTIRDWYVAYNAGRPLAVERSAHYWVDWLNVGPETIPPGLLIGESGYVRLTFRDDGSRATLREIGGADEAIPALLAAAIARAAERGARRLYLEAPLDPEVVEVAHRLLDDRQEHIDDGMMWMPLDRPLPEVARAPRAPIYWSADGF